MLDFINEMFYPFQQIILLLFRLPLVSGVSIGSFLFYVAVVNIISSALWGGNRRD